MMVNVRGIIPFYGRTIQVSEFEFTQNQMASHPQADGGDQQKFDDGMRELRKGGIQVWPSPDVMAAGAARVLKWAETFWKTMGRTMGRTIGKWRCTL